jgi:hypothetical protein
VIQVSAWIETKDKGKNYEKFPVILAFFHAIYAIIPASDSAFDHAGYGGHFCIRQVRGLTEQKISSCGEKLFLHISARTLSAIFRRKL